MKNQSILPALTFWAVLISHPASAQVALTGNHYTQNFDSIGSGLPAGWSVMTNATSASLGTAALFVTAATSWSSSSGQFANYASTTNNDGTPFIGTESTPIQSVATNRSLGVRPTGSLGDPGAAFVLRIQNTLGLGNFQLNLDLNMLSVQGRSNTWTIDYGLGDAPTAFTTLGTYTDPVSYGATNRSFSFGNALDNKGQAVWIRIVALATSSGSGSRDTFGIDNVALSYTPLAPVSLNLQLIGTDTVLTWSNATFGLQSAPFVTGPYTNVLGATSPHTNPIAGPQTYFRLKAN